MYGSGYRSGYGGSSGASGNAYERAIRQKEQSYESPMRQQYGGFGQSIMDRLPGRTPPAMPQRPTGMRMMGAPASPSPVYSGRMQTNGMGTQSMGGGMGMAPQAAGGRAPWLMGPHAPSGFDEQILQLPQDMQERLNDFNQSLYAGPDYKGRHEAAQMLKAQYARLLMEQAAQPEIDFSGSSAVADQFGNQRERMLSALAARGVSGSGVEAGALANSYGNQAKAQGQFYRDAMEQRRREQLAQQIAFENWARGIEGQGLKRNWGEQDAPGFFDKLLDVVGGVAGSIIPGGAGGAVKAATGLLGGGGSPQGTNVGPGYGYGGAGDYPPVDWNDPYAYGYGG